MALRVAPRELPADAQVRPRVAVLPEAAHAPACAALLGVVCAGVGYLQLPAVTRKVCLAGLALGVLLVGGIGAIV